MNRSPILGTRGSPLALAQAHKVASALEVANRWPADFVQIQTVQTTGDQVQDRPLAEIGGKQLWTKELDRALLGGGGRFLRPFDEGRRSDPPARDQHRRGAPARRRPGPADRRGFDRRAAARGGRRHLLAAAQGAAAVDPARTSRSCRCAATCRPGWPSSKPARSRRPCSRGPGCDGSAWPMSARRSRSKSCFPRRRRR